MIIQCESCSRKFIVKDSDIPKDGRTVQCGYCSVTWHQMPLTTPTRTVKKPQVSKPIVEADESPSVDSIEASDGKTYRFLGSQWTELLPSGKTGLFARKKRLEEVDPSSESLDEEKRLPDVNKPKQGLGFFGYIFLLIIIGFSMVGILKTFENDLLNNFPETEYIYQLLDEQLEFLAESVKNLIVIVDDLINSY